MTGSSRASVRIFAAVVSFLLLVGVQTVATTSKASAVPAAVTITGTIVDSLSNQPVAGVVLADEGGAATATTVANGTYSLAVPAGDHVLSATRAGYVPANSPLLTGLVAGSTVSDINFTMDRYASASGKATDAALSTGIGSVVVKLFDASGTDANPAYTATTGADGTWSLGAIVPGAYKVQFDAASTDYTSVWFQGTTRDNAQVQNLAPSGAGVMSAWMAKGAKVSGTITDGGTPLAGAYVYLRSQNSSWVAGPTDASGTYLFRGLPADQYTMYATHPGRVKTWLGGAESASGAEYFAVADAAVIANKDIALSSGGTIQGTVSPRPTSAGAMAVYAVTTEGDWYWGAVSTVDGTYSIPDLPASNFAVEFFGTGYKTQYFDGATSINAATLVTLGHGSTAAGIDATLVLGTVTISSPATIAGTVTDLDGVGLPGVAVLAPASGANAVTGPDGRYTMQVNTSDSWLNFSRDGYASATATAVPQVGITFQVGEVRLSRVVTVSGTVTAGSSHTPLGGAWVTIVGSDGGAKAGTAAASDGTYSFTNLPEGYYTVLATSVQNTDYAPSYYGGAISKNLATYFAAPAGSSVTGIDVHLDKVASLSGTVKLPGGAGAAKASVTLSCEGYTTTVTAGQDGTFTVGGLPAGSYRLSASLSPWGVVWWENARTEAVSTAIPVVAGDSLSGKVLTLPVGQTVSGLVTNGGETAPGVAVSLLGADGQVETVLTDGSGLYAFRGVPQGSYRIGAASGYDTVWLPGTTNQDHATPFDVTTTDVVKDIAIPQRVAVTVTVKGSDGTTPSTGTVGAYDAWGQVASGGDVVAGSTVLSLFPGTYAFNGSASGYVPVRQQATITAAATVSLTLPVGGRITGALSGNAPEGIVIARNVTTGIGYTGNVSGASYTLGALPAGTYVVSVIPFSGGSANQQCGTTSWYGGSDYIDATRVTVSNGASTQVNLSAQCLPSSATYAVSGKLVLPSGFTLTAGTASSISIALQDTETGLAAGDVYPAANGTFSFSDVPPGTYAVLVNANSLGLTAGTQLVTVTASNATVSVKMYVEGSITGRVVDGFGHAIAVTVHGVASSGDTVDVYTSNGKYTLSGLSTDLWTVTVRPPAPYSETEVGSYGVALGTVTNAGTTTLHSGGRITGTLPKDLMGSASITVDVTDWAGVVKATATLSTGGDYTVWGVPAGTAYVRFTGPGIATQWWVGATALGTATPVTVVADKAVSGISPALIAASTSTQYVVIRGKVTGPDGPIPQAAVSAVSLHDDVSTVTAADGTYELTVPAGDTYRVSVFICLGAADSELGCTGDYFTDSHDVVVGTSDVGGVDFVVAKVFTGALIPTISGVAVVGQTLTANTGTWSPVPTSLTYQWFAGSTAIGGATTKTLTLTDAQLGKVITVAVTGVKFGYVVTTLTSDPLGPVKTADQIVGQIPLIFGYPAVGYTLSVDASSYFAGNSAVTYQWLRNGVTIPGATATTYAPVPADVGHTLTVLMTGARAGYAPQPVESMPVGPIESSTSALGYQAFVKASYQDFLGRQPNIGELSIQSTALSQGRVSVADYLTSLSRSDEWLSAIVTKMYADTLHRSPDPSGLAGWVKALRTNQWSVAQVASFFYASDEYFKDDAHSSTSEWVTLLYQKLLNRTPDPLGLAQWVKQTNDPKYGRSWVAYNFYQSDESRMKRVQGLYQTLLSRDPDPVGWAWWKVTVLSTGDLVLATQIAGSQEYREKANIRY